MLATQETRGIDERRKKNVMAGSSDRFSLSMHAVAADIDAVSRQRPLQWGKLNEGARIINDG